MDDDFGGPSAPDTLPAPGIGNTPVVDSQALAAENLKKRRARLGRNGARIDDPALSAGDGSNAGQFGTGISIVG